MNVKEKTTPVPIRLRDAVLPLVSPRKGFFGPGFPAVAPVILFVSLFAVYTAGRRLEHEFYLSPQHTLLELQDARAAIDRMMEGAPDSARTEALRSAAESLTGEGSAVLDAVSTSVPGGLFLLYLTELWALLVLYAQFAGGEELPVGERRHRRSLMLAAYTLAPLALRELASGLLVGLQDPSGVRNAVSAAGYRAATGISFSPLSLLELDPVPAFVRFMLLFLTDPFFIWAGVVLWAGCREVFRLKGSRAAIPVFVMAAAFALNETALESIGLQAQLGRVV